MAGIFSLENDDSFLNVTNEAKKRVKSNTVNSVTNDYLKMSYDKKPSWKPKQTNVDEIYHGPYQLYSMLYMQSIDS